MAQHIKPRLGGSRATDQEVLATAGAVIPRLRNCEIEAREETVQIERTDLRCSWEQPSAETL